MALPTKEKTWEFDVNRWYQHTSTSDEVTAREMMFNIKNQILGASHTGYQGTITQIVAGVTYQLECNDVGADATRPGSENFTSDLIGKYVEIVAATSGGNNGVFEITAVPAVNQIQYANATGVAEAFVGSFRISNGKFTSGAGSVQATETLTFVGNASDGETVTIASRVYTFKAVLDGATADTVFIGATASDSLDNLIACINRDAGEGTLYGGLTRDNFNVIASAGAGDTMDVVAKPRGNRGNSIAVSTTVTGASWGAANLSGGLDGHFPAWRCKGSHGLGKGAALDGIDRWQDDAADMVSSSSGTGTRSWQVLRNEVTGAEFCFFNYTNTTTEDFERSELVVSPEMGFTGGATNARPTASDQVVVANNTQNWMGHTASADQTWVFHMMHSDDGEDTRFFGFAWDNGYFTFISDRVKDARKNGPSILWNGSQNVMDWTFTNGEVNVITNWRDNAQLRLTIDKDAGNGGPYVVGAFMGSEHYVSSSLMESFVSYRDELANEFLVVPVAIAVSTVGVRGRHGRISDFWYGNAAVDRHIPQGSTYPADGSHQFVKIGHFMLPWAGVKMRTS